MWHRKTVLDIENGGSINTILKISNIDNFLILHSMLIKVASQYIFRQHLFISGMFFTNIAFFLNSFSLKYMVWPLPSLNLDKFIVANRDPIQNQKQNSKPLDPSHLDLHFCISINLDLQD